MSDARTPAIAGLLETLAQDLDRLEKAGSGIPAVEKNVTRMRGALNVLRIQFDDLARVLADAGNG